MANPLTLKLEQFTRLDAVDRQRLDQLLTHKQKTFKPGEVMIPEGKHVGEIHLVLSGLAVRSKQMPDGGRQIMAFLVPGDLCDAEVFVLEAMDHDISAVSETTCAVIPSRVIEDLLTESSTLTRCLWWSTMTDSAVLRERIIDHGRRDARERLAHLFYEMLIRFRIVLETSDNTYPFPPTQEELADATGMTPVHLNRVVQQLRTDGLIEWKDKMLTVLDPPRLRKVAGFHASYLHLTRTENRDREVSGRADDLVAPSHTGLAHRVLGQVRDTFKTHD